jgi:hypothetical protein
MTEDRSKGENVSIIRGSPIKILIGLIVIGLLLVPVISAGTLNKSYKSESSLMQFNLLHIRAGSQQTSHIYYEFSRTGDYVADYINLRAGLKVSVENSTACGTCESISDRFHPLII